ncbi:TPA: AIPR family protein [Stenotrophomonas maltophilia]
MFTFVEIGMSRLHTSQIATRLKATFGSALNPHGELNDDMFLSRALAAHAVQMATDCSVQDAVKSIWDGQDDNGIDAAYYEADEARVILVQSKWIHAGFGEPAAKDIGSFIKGAFDLIEVNASGFHARLASKVADITKRLQEPGTTIHLIVASTGASVLSPPATAHITRFEEEVNSGGITPIASSSTIGLKEVYSSIASDGARGNVSLDCQMLHWHFVREPYPAYFGLVDGLTIRQWWKDHGKRLLSSNIRHSLGTTDVNAQIRQTAEDAPERFWYFNNGITVIAENTSQAPAAGSTRDAGVFSLLGASIVNGAQTVSTLGLIEDETSLGKVRVSVRVILLNHAPDKFGEEVAKANNLQNRIEPRDFVAQDPQQHRLREEMAMEHIDYQYMRSDEYSPSANSCDVLEVTSALACALGKSNLAVQVKTGLGRFYVDLTKPPYTTIFNPGTTGSRAFNAAICLRAIDAWIESAKSQLPKKSGPKHGVLVHGNRILASLAFALRLGKHLDKPVSDFNALAPHVGPSFRELMEALAGYAEQVLQKDYEGRHLAILFKNPSESGSVFDAVMARAAKHKFKVPVGTPEPSTPATPIVKKVAIPKRKVAKKAAKKVATPAPLI